MTVDAEGFEQKLTETMRPGSSKVKEDMARTDAMDVDTATGVEEESQLANAQAQKLQGLAKKIEKFVEGDGTLEGAVFDEYVPHFVTFGLTSD